MSKRGKIIICSKCNRERRNAGRGLCSSCYGVEYRNFRARMITCNECALDQRHFAKGYCFSCYSKIYRQENLDRYAEHERNRRANNPEHVRQLDRQRNQKESRKRWKREYHQVYYATNKPKLLKYQVNYRRANPIQRDNYKRARRARVLGLPATLTEQEWQQILQEHNYSCAYCGDIPSRIEREHKLPAIRGGGYTAENIVPSCPACNRRKGRMTDDEFRQYLIDYP